MKDAILLFLAVFIAPICGGLLMGLDRRLSARMQNRVGPPIVQPFYDIIKLFAKQRQECNGFQWVSVWVYLASMMLSLWMLMTGQDMLVLLFIIALGNVMLILGAFSVRSPYSQLGAQREVMSMLAYEPLLVFMVVGAYLKSGSFTGTALMQMHEPLLLSLPLFLFTQTMVLAIKLHKSPFDIAASHHAHQELVRGLYTEFSGPQLALIELAHLYELMLLLGFIALLWHTNLMAGAILALICLFAVILLDNITARLTWRWMLRFSWTIGVGLCVVNLAVLYLIPNLISPQLLLSRLLAMGGLH